MRNAANDAANDAAMKFLMSYPGRNVGYDPGLVGATARDVVTFASDRKFIMVLNLIDMIYTSNISLICSLFSIPLFVKIFFFSHLIH